jgi:cyclic pyranopterin phosphate synthase
MTQRVVPLSDYRNRSTVHVPDRQIEPRGILNDRLQRSLRDLRISVTDRCNFRCVYCMPRDVFDEDYAFAPQSALLSFEEITRLARLFIAHGVRKIRLTGGEPLLRKNIERLVAMLAALQLPDGTPLDLTLTTNGSLLERKAAALKDAGLTRVTVSLDALDDAVFRRMNDADFSVAAVLAGLDEASRVGLGPVKVNMVVKRGLNDQEIVPMARHFRGSGHILRFIEYMDVGNSNGWRLDEVVPSSEVVARINALAPIVPIEHNYEGEVAQRWRYADGSGELGMISSVTQAFCGSCTRARLSTEGNLYTCLFATAATDFRAPLRSGASDALLSNLIAAVWSDRSDRYSEVRGAQTEGLSKVEMSYIGG